VPEIQNTQKLIVLQKIMDCHENYDTLLPNGMPSHHHMEDQVIINRKEQQYRNNIFN